MRGYGLDGPGFDSRQGKDVSLFSKTPRTAVRPTQPSVKREPGLIPRG